MNYDEVRRIRELLKGGHSVVTTDPQALAEAARTVVDELLAENRTLQIKNGEIYAAYKAASAEASS